ncbi:MAG TPA: energy transducer TonB [Ferruginibacter sp.]|nr:energy transducer TonB [Ferruginibacter sp.]
MRKINYIKVLFSLVISFTYTRSLHAQNTPIIKYYNADWSPVSKDSAVYFTEFVKENDNYHTTSYWIKSNKLQSNATYADTLFAKPVGLLLRYYETGLKEDSTYYENGVMKDAYHYYPGGKLWVHYTYNPKNKKEVTQGFDEKGEELEDFIYQKEAEFPGGGKSWVEFLSETMHSDVPVKKKAPVGKYQVIARFIVDKKGKVTDIVAETNHGYGMEEEVIRVLKKSPKWEPAIHLGKQVNAYRRQPITFVVSEK